MDQYYNMAKKAEQNKVCDKSGLTLEHNTVYDDNLLPSADELAKLNSVSDKIVPWIMERTEMEQNARIKFNEERVAITKKDFKHKYAYNFTALIMAFVIVLLFVSLSFYLILNGQETIGTIFAGGTMVLIVSYFLKASKNREVK